MRGLLSDQVRRVSSNYDTRTIVRSLLADSDILCELPFEFGEVERPIRYPVKHRLDFDSLFFNKLEARVDNVVDLDGPLWVAISNAHNEVKGATHVIASPSVSLGKDGNHLWEECEGQGLTLISSAALMDQSIVWIVNFDPVSGIGGVQRRLPDLNCGKAWVEWEFDIVVPDGVVAWGVRV